MEKVPEYDIITSDELEDFLEKVNEALKNGWQLYGNPFSRHTVNSGDMFNQALIKYMENERGSLGFSRRE